jgi:putative SOS response-associated peptidase YedK
MCRRYDNIIAREAHKALFRAERLPASNFPPRYNVAPTDTVLIIRVDPRDGVRDWSPFCYRGADRPAMVDRVRLLYRAQAGTGLYRLSVAPARGHTLSLSEIFYCVTWPLSSGLMNFRAQGPRVLI